MHNSGFSDGYDITASFLTEANYFGWTYIVILLTCAVMPLVTRPKHGVKIAATLMALFSIPVAVRFFEMLPQLHMEATSFSTFQSFFDMTWYWSASYPLWGFGAIVFSIWPVALGIGALLLYGAYNLRMRQEDNLQFQARLAAHSANDRR